MFSLFHRRQITIAPVCNGVVSTAVGPRKTELVYSFSMSVRRFSLPPDHRGKTNLVWDWWCLSPRKSMIRIWEQQTSQVVYGAVSMLTADCNKNYRTLELVKMSYILKVFGRIVLLDANTWLQFLKIAACLWMQETDLSLEKLRLSFLDVGLSSSLCTLHFCYK